MGKVLEPLGCDPNKKKLIQYPFTGNSPCTCSKVRGICVSSRTRTRLNLGSPISTVQFFFFQAEDGIRDTSVTGVQTCALPIWQTDRPARRPPGDAQDRLRK